MKVITFSQKFPVNHPKKGQPTYFMERIWSGLADNLHVMDDIDFNGIDFDFKEFYNGIPKVHTIRAGTRWKVGEIFSPRIWLGKPYHSKQRIFAPPIQIKKIWNIEINFQQTSPIIKINGLFHNHGTPIAKNDGLSMTDFIGWFLRPFEGQIICWDESVEY